MYLYKIEFEKLRDSIEDTKNKYIKSVKDFIDKNNMVKGSKEYSEYVRVEYIKLNVINNRLSVCKDIINNKEWDKVDASLKNEDANSNIFELASIYVDSLIFVYEINKLIDACEIESEIKKDFKKLRDIVVKNNLLNLDTSGILTQNIKNLRFRIEDVSIKNTEVNDKDVKDKYVKNKNILSVTNSVTKALVIANENVELGAVNEWGINDKKLDADDTVDRIKDKSDSTENKVNKKDSKVDKNSTNCIIEPRLIIPDENSYKESDNLSKHNENCLSDDKKMTSNELIRKSLEMGGSHNIASKSLDYSNDPVFNALKSNGMISDDARNETLKLANETKAKIRRQIDDLEKKNLSADEITEATCQDLSKPTIIINDKFREVAVKAGLIPKGCMQDEFNSTKVKDNIRLQGLDADSKDIVHFSEYEKILNKIISDLSMGKLPDSSYIIGAPNGFGKTSFATSCILRLFSRSFRAVPYVSLSELSELKFETDRRSIYGIRTKEHRYADVLKDETVKVPFHDFEESKCGLDGMYVNKPSYYVDIEDDEYSKMPEFVTGRYSWSEYMNSDLLITYLTSEISREVESRILKVILNTRGAKRLPTIVMVDSSLKVYLSNPTLRRYLWDDMLSYSKEVKSYDRLIHVSTFKNIGNDNY